jgi:acetolactate synthase regulatory subunit
MNKGYATVATDNGDLGRVTGQVTERKVAVVSVDIPELFDNDYTSIELVVNGRRYGTMSIGKARQLGILPR